MSQNIAVPNNPANTANSANSAESANHVRPEDSFLPSRHSHFAPPVVGPNKKKSLRHLTAKANAYASVVNFYTMKIDRLEVNSFATIGLCFLYSTLAGAIAFALILIGIYGVAEFADNLLASYLVGLVIGALAALVAIAITKIRLYLYRRRIDAAVDAKIAAENEYFDMAGRFPSTYNSHQRFFRR